MPYDYVREYLDALIEWLRGIFCEPEQPEEGEKMDIVKLLQELMQKINDLTQALADASAAADSIAKENYDKGFADGVASMQSDKIYSQAELDAAVSSAKAEMQVMIDGLTLELDGAKLQIADLGSQIEALKLEIEGLKDVSKQVEAAIEAEKAKFLAAWEAMDGAETAAEQEFKKLFAPKVVEQPPVDETPVEETPVEETPIEETPVEETPVEETPVDEGEPQA